jgi:hypothetical protein
MKAEALLRQGDEAGALAIVNDIRSRAGAAARTTLTLMISLKSVVSNWLGKV